MPEYSDTAIAVVDGNDFYFGSQKQNSVHYDLQAMIQTQGPAGSDPVTNAKWTIIRDYVEQSGAFSYNSATGNYSITNNDGFANGQIGGGCYIWTDTIYNVQRGYCLYVSPQISQQELDSGVFDGQTFRVNKLWGKSELIGQSQQNTYFNISKMEFFDLWLGQKLKPTSYGGNPPDPSGYTGLDSLASDFATFLSEPQSYFQNGGSTAKDFSAKVQGLLTKATSLGFPTPKGVLDQQADFVNSIINDFIGLIQSVWNAITTFIGSVVNFIMTVWNDIVSPVLGVVTEVVKGIVELSINAFTALISSIINDAMNSPITNAFSSVIWFMKSNSIDLNDVFSNMLPSGVSSTINSLRNIPDFSSTINQGVGMFNLFNFPLIDQIKTLIPTILIIEVISELFQQLIFSAFSSILLTSNFNTLSSDMSNFLYSQQNVNTIVTDNQNISTSNILFSETGGFSAGSIGSKLNINSLNGVSTSLKNNNPSIKMINGFNQESVLSTLAVNLVSALSSGFYLLLTGPYGDPTNEINDLINLGQKITEKSFYTSILLAASFISRGLTYYNSLLYNPASPFQGDQIDSIISHGTTINVAGISIAPKEQVRLITSIMGIISDFIGIYFSEECVSVYGEHYNFLVSDFRLEVLITLSETLKVIGDIAKADNELSDGNLISWIFYLAYVVFGFVSVFYLIIDTLNKFLNPLDSIYAIGGLFLTVSYVITGCYIVNDIIVLDKTQRQESIQKEPIQAYILDFIIPNDFFKKPNNFEFVSEFVLDVGQILLFELT